MRSLKVDCDRLNDSAIELLLRPPAHELCLHNCADFSGKLLSEVGRRCRDLRFELSRSILHAEKLQYLNLLSILNNCDFKMSISGIPKKI